MAFGDIVDELHDEHRLSYSGSAEKSNLATLHIGLEQVDDLDARGKHLLVCGQLVELRGLAVDRISARHVEGLHSIDRLAGDVHHSAFDLFTERHGDRAACGYHFKVALQSVGIVHSHASHGVLTNVLLHLNDEVAPVRAFNL